MYCLLVFHITLGNHGRFGFLRLVMCTSFTKGDVLPFRVSLPLPFQRISLSYWWKYLHCPCKYSKRAKFFPSAFLTHWVLRNSVRNELVHCLLPVISGITHTIPTEPFLIFLIGEIIFLIAVTQCVICFTFIEIILLAFKHFIQLLPCCQTLPPLTKQTAYKAFCVALVNFPNSSCSDELCSFSLGTSLQCSCRL